MSGTVTSGPLIDQTKVARDRPVTNHVTRPPNSARQLGLFDYPNSAGYKRLGTSADAARAMDEGRGSSLRDAIYRLYAGGWTGTADEAADKVGASILAIRPRVSELQAKGLIEETGDRRRSSGGRMASVWRWVA